MTCRVDLDPEEADIPTSLPRMPNPLGSSSHSTRSAEACTRSHTLDAMEGSSKRPESERRRASSCMVERRSRVAWKRVGTLQTSSQLKGKSEGSLFGIKRRPPPATAGNSPRASDANLDTLGVDSSILYCANAAARTKEVIKVAPGTLPAWFEDIRGARQTSIAESKHGGTPSWASGDWEQGLVDLEGDDGDDQAEVMMSMHNMLEDRLTDGVKEEGINVTFRALHRTTVVYTRSFPDLTISALSVGGFRVVDGGFGHGKHAEYQIMLTRGEKAWKGWRRFTSFKKMLHPSVLQLPQLYAKWGAIESKRLLGFFNHLKVTYLYGRCLAIEEYLQELLSLVCATKGLQPAWSHYSIKLIQFMQPKTHT
ncbi:unnamed protein product [Chrysoparadoxa australica]